jgi:uncharacterized protein YyaL (SSP411 family)
MLRLFWDDGISGFFDTGNDHETLISRPRDFWDNATPSGHSVAADVLLRLAVITGDDVYRQPALASLAGLAGLAERAPLGFSRMLAAVDFDLASPRELALVWEGNGPEPLELAAAAFAGYRPNLIAVGARAGEGGGVTPLLQDRPALNGLPTAYVCERFVCRAPTTDSAEMLRQLDAQT